MRLDRSETKHLKTLHDNVRMSEMRFCMSYG